MSSRNWPDDVLVPFGKYRGETLAEVLAYDAAYIGWLAESADIRSEAFRAAVDRVAADHADEIETARRTRREELR